LKKNDDTAISVMPNVEPLQDPYAHLKTNVVTPEDTATAMKWTVQNVPDWGSPCMCWTWGIAAFVRNSSIQNIYLSDLLCDDAHGPESGDVSTKNMMCLVLRKGNVHKDGYTYDRVVGSWRHKNYITCSVGMLAMSIMVRMFNLGSNITFDLRYQNFPHFWRNIPIIKYGEHESSTAYGYAYNDIRKILVKCGIQTYKKCHFRTSGVDLAGFLGLDERDIASMTKHKQDKLGDCYMPELKKRFYVQCLDLQKIKVGMLVGATYIHQIILKLNLFFPTSMHGWLKLIAQLATKVRTTLCMKPYRIWLLLLCRMAFIGCGISQTMR
jgi:hypothetical protein